MPTLLIEMPAGVAGDMLLAALIDLGADAARIAADLESLHCGSMRLIVTAKSISGIAAKQLDVDVPQQAQWQIHHHDHGHRHANVLAPAASAGHQHRTWRSIRGIIDAASLPERVKQRAQRVFRLLAEAEGQVHGVAADEVEFHEVGSLDAIADIVGCCLAMEQLGIERVVAGPLRPGRGQVRCAHGLMPVPVPAVAAILARTGAPNLQEATDTGELTTPTGAALVCGLADAWLTAQAVLVTTTRIGYGAGHRVIPGVTSVVRVSLMDENAPTEQVAELSCQVDDATGEQLAALLDELLEIGALDACLAPVLMKKGRPGHVLTVLCAVQDRPRVAAFILSRSTSIGVRHRVMERTVLPRRQVTVQVEGHEVRIKVVRLPDGSERGKPEADDVIALARTLGRDVASVQQAALDAWRHAGPPAE
jgi:uncharacterized protein (TIGR00299 family) protein